jgi:hypothetical protein
MKVDVRPAPKGKYCDQCNSMSPRTAIVTVVDPRGRVGSFCGPHAEEHRRGLAEMNAAWARYTKAHP